MVGFPRTMLLPLPADPGRIRRGSTQRDRRLRQVLQPSRQRDAEALFFSIDDVPWKHALQRALQEMRKLLQSGGATEGRLEELLREVKAVESEQAPAIRRDLDAVDAVLSPVQQAKYRILELEVERKIREVMTQMRGQARPSGRGRPRNGEEPPRP